MLPIQPVYVFDTNSISALKSYYPEQFPGVWVNLTELITSDRLISSSFVLKEIQGHEKTMELEAWVKTNRTIFRDPDAEQTQFLREILREPRYQAMLTPKQQRSGRQPADGLLIALARHTANGCIITEERARENSVRIPNICDELKIPCTNLQGLMRHEGWRFTA